jgi:hypothetical protein
MHKTGNSQIDKDILDSITTNQEQMDSSMVPSNSPVSPANPVLEVPAAQADPVVQGVPP